MTRHPGQNDTKRGGLLRLAVFAIALHFAFLSQFAWAAERGDENLEYDVKAAMLYNFTRFVEWPAAAWKEPRAPMVVGVFGSDPFGRILDQTMQDKNYAGHPILVRRIHSVAEVDGCNLLFIGKSEKKHAGEILHAAQTGNILTVSDIEEFVQSGGAIGFVMVDNRVRFEINTAGAAKAGLTISSKLLRLAIPNERRGRGN